MSEKDDIPSSMLVSCTSCGSSETCSEVAQRAAAAHKLKLQKQLNPNGRRRKHSNSTKPFPVRGKLLTRDVSNL